MTGVRSGGEPALDASPRASRSAGPPPGPMHLPLRETAPAFRWFFAGSLAALVVAVGWAVTAAPGASVVEVFSSPGMVGLMLLIVLADLYPLRTRMQGVPGVENVMVSAPLSIAALLAYGPPAAVVFVVSGLLGSLRGRWWRAVLNMTLWGLQGVAGAVVLVALGGPDPAVWTAPQSGGVWLLMVAAALVVVVIEVVNGVLIGIVYVLIGQENLREYLSGCLSGRAVAMIGLIAPIGAVTALEVPWLLPLVAVGIVGSLEAVRTVWRRTVLAGTDPLTGSANRAALMARLRTQLAQLDRTHGRVAVLLVDLDGFKGVNDEFGHGVGDQVLIEVANRIGTVTRTERDLVARFGGDEFAVLLGGGPVPPVGLEPGEGDVEVISARIRAAIAEPMRFGEHVLVIEASVGWAVAASSADEPGELFERADAELYSTKTAANASRRVRGAVPVDDSPGWSGPVWTSAPPTAIAGTGALPGQHTR